MSARGAVPCSRCSTSSTKYGLPFSNSRPARFTATPPHVVGVEVALLRERLREQQRHRRVVVEGGAFGRGGEIAHALGERFPDRLRGAEPLGRYAQLVADYEPEQRTTCAGEQQRIESVARGRRPYGQHGITTAPLEGATRAAKPFRSAWGPT